MTFGDDIFYNRLKLEYYSENNEEIHTLLYRMIRKKTAQMFPAYAHIMEDLQQEVAAKIMGKDIHRFLQNEVHEFSPYRVAKRNDWFQKAVRHAGLDFLKKELRHAQTPVYGSMDPEKPGKPIYAAIQHLDTPVGDNEDGEASLLNFISDRSASEGLSALLSGERVDNAFRALFSLSRTKPEKIMVCAFAILADFHGLAGAKELNRTVAGLLDGKTFSEIADALERMLRLAQITPTVIEPLRKRLDETDADGARIGDCRFDIDTRTVTHQFSSTRKQLRDSFADEEDSSSPAHNVVPFPSHRKDG